MTESQTLKTDLLQFLEANNLPAILTKVKVQRTLVNLYHQATGRVLDCSGCGNTVKAALAELTKLAASEGEIVVHKPKPMNYQLKEKTRIYVSCLGMMVTPANCTDNIAMAMLGENPDLEARFDKLPKDWKQQSGDYYYNMTTPASKRKLAPSTPKQAEAVMVSEEPPTASAASETKTEPKAEVKAKAITPKAEPVKAPAPKKAKTKKKKPAIK